MSSKVYFLKIDELDKLKGLLPEFDLPLGVKVHFGEQGNTTFVPANIIKEVCSSVGEYTFVETGVLYRSVRSKASTHQKLAQEHGFNFAPIEFLDGENGDWESENKTGGEFIDTVYLGKGLDRYKSLLVLSHFKGHIATGFGGAIKNIGMGLASRRGKLAMHGSIQHEVSKDICISCGKCIEDCPVDAISKDKNKKAEIDGSKCIGCSKCIAVCPVEAVKIPWDSTGTDVLQQRIVEYAKTATEGKQCFYVNFLINITRGCDCMGEQMEKLTDDIGVLVSDDPVAIDRASCDMARERSDSFGLNCGKYQLSHGEKIGLGKEDYKIIKL